MGGQELAGGLSLNEPKTRLKLARECGHTAAETLRVQALEALSCRHDVLIDAAEVEHLHASVAQVLLALSVAARDAGRQARIAPGGDSLRLALESAGMTQYFRNAGHDVFSISDKKA